MKCLENIIGVSRKECKCFEGDAQESWKKSTSGLFLDELNGGITLDSINSVMDCGAGLADLFAQSIELAKLCFKADLMAEMATRYKLNYDPFVGTIGSKSFARTKYMTSNYAGLKLISENIAGTYLTIKAITTYFDQTAALSVKLVKGLYDASSNTWRYEEIKTISLSAVAHSGKVNTLTEPITLPLFDPEGYRVEYFLFYQRSLTQINPKDNAVRCNCGTSESRLLQYVKTAGIQFEAELTTNENLQNLQHYGEINGIGIEGEIRCGSEDLICDVFYSSEANSLVIGYATWYKAGEILLDKILASPEINRYTMMNREYLYGKRNSYKTEYFQRIQWLVENMKAPQDGCYTCNDQKMPTKVGIML